VFQRMSVALAAVALTAAVATTSTPASAHHWSHGWGPGGFGIELGVGLATTPIIAGLNTEQTQHLLSAGAR
jgi:hypothetical protein